MKEIQLTRGKVAIVDDADFDQLTEFEWSAKPKSNCWYAHRADRSNGRNTTVTMHQQIMGCMADHKNGDGLDNRRENLRPCTYGQNCGNRILGTSNTSGFKGACKPLRSNKYRVRCGGAYLGEFSTAEDAARAYDAAAVERWGEFACINFPENYPHLNLRCARRTVAA